MIPRFSPPATRASCWLSLIRTNSVSSPSVRNALTTASRMRPIIVPEVVAMVSPLPPAAPWPVTRGSDRLR